MTEKRKRGRPPGTGKDDSQHLQKVAELLVETPGLRPTTAMHRVLSTRKWDETDATLIRRWQVKWKVEGERYLAEARQAREARRARASELAAQSGSAVYAPNPYASGSLLSQAIAGAFPLHSALAGYRSDIPRAYLNAFAPDISALAAAQGLSSHWREHNRLLEEMRRTEELQRQARLQQEAHRQLREQQEIQRMILEHRIRYGL